MATRVAPAHRKHAKHHLAGTEGYAEPRALPDYQTRRADHAKQTQALVHDIGNTIRMFRNDRLNIGPLRQKLERKGRDVGHRIPLLEHMRWSPCAPIISIRLKARKRRFGRPRNPQLWHTPRHFLHNSYENPRVSFRP